MPSLLPVFLDLNGAIVLVSGDGPASSSFTKRVEALGASVRKANGSADLAGALMFAAGSADAAADAVLMDAARERGLLVIELHAPKDARAFVGESSGDGHVQVAATTCGGSAEFERRLAAEAGKTLRPEHQRFAEILRSVRGKLEERFPDDALRASIWQQIIDSPVMVLLESGAEDEALEMAERMAWGTG